MRLQFCIDWNAKKSVKWSKDNNQRMEEDGDTRSSVLDFHCFLWVNELMEIVMETGKTKLNEEPATVLFLNISKYFW